MYDAHHLSWGAEVLWRQLEPLLPGLSIEVVARAESTNTALLDRAKAASGRHDAPVTRPGTLAQGAAAVPPTPHGRRRSDTQPCLLVAEHQTRGRGRMGRDWQASPLASLTFSLALPLAPRDWSGLSLAVGVALADALDPHDGHGPRIGLKWPNDLWLLEGSGLGRKLGGVLIETVPVGERRMCVVGVGLNVLPQALEDLAHGYACLQELDRAITAPQALVRVAAPLVRALQRFEHEGFGAFVAGYRARDLLIGRAVDTNTAECPQGVAEGVDEGGALLVRADGELHRIVGGEVSVRLRRAALP